ncbi:adenylate/guanylate cyclase domain-containing protein [Micromonospora sp. WMMD1076]|uniref:adenylate/guanylate cyclase domain-containing protein n=1 Tax=Micromonospora sp. WMMD1076 TaxID=3016103 RepID=UPI002499E019|nr:adenylate/guanylate cyclase domain-containing protein [Micromonospora sp. WMMD1076]WFF05540.1 adenylate/guanylate cyclase domain-containing protein [Micromonospora sp. WMMD1076]
MLITTPAASRKAVIAACRPVPEERRIVTVLFVDIVGSTRLVERLDPEDVRALQRAYFGTVASVLRRWRGVVEKYVGDAVMALFGASGSDGLDAYRAVRAGLDIQAALERRRPAGIRLRVRVGVATGEVLLDLAGVRDGGHGAASGAVITTAARLQEHAPPGGVVVCPVTRSAVAGLVEQRPLATLTLAGKALPLDVWRVTGTAGSRPARHRVPLVGRRRELASAADEVTRALRERRPRWISLVGPPGSGRSRLLHEVTRAVSRVDGVPVRRRVTACPPYPCGELAPVADLVRPRPDGSVADGPGGGVLAAFLAAPDDDAVAATAVAACREALLGLAADAPVVVAVDDLDRAAPALRRFLHQLHVAAGERGLPLAVVTTCGSGSADPLPAPARRIPVEPLGPLDTGRLLRHLLDRAGRPAALAARLVALVGGSPAVATAYVTADPAGEPGGVPAAARRLVDARLDRLDGTHRAVLLAGAARSGPVVAASVEAMLGWSAGRADPVLRALAAAGLIRQVTADGWTVDALVARVAAMRLSRAVRADFARRLRVAKDTAADPVPGAGSVPSRGAGEREVCPLGAGRSRRSGGGARPAPVPPDRPDGSDALRPVPGQPIRAGALRAVPGRPGQPVRAGPATGGATRTVADAAERSRWRSSPSPAVTAWRARQTDPSPVVTRWNERRTGPPGRVGRNRRRTEPGGQALGLAA